MAAVILKSNGECVPAPVSRMPLLGHVATLLGGPIAHTDTSVVLGDTSVSARILYRHPAPEMLPLNLPLRFITDPAVLRRGNVVVVFLDKLKLRGDVCDYIKERVRDESQRLMTSHSKSK